MGTAAFSAPPLLSWQVDGLIRQVEAILVIRHNVDEAVPKLGLLQAEYTLINLFLQQLSSIFVVHELAHSRSQQALVVELLVLSLSCASATIFAIFLSSARASRMLLGIFRLSGVRLVVEKSIVHKLLFNILHPFVDFVGAAFLSNFDPIRREVNFLLTTSLPVEMPLLRKVLLAEVVFLSAG